MAELTADYEKIVGSDTSDAKCVSDLTFAAAVSKLTTVALWGQESVPEFQFLQRFARSRVLWI